MIVETIARTGIAVAAAFMVIGLGFMYGLIFWYTPLACRPSRRKAAKHIACLHLIIVALAWATWGIYYLETHP